MRYRNSHNQTHWSYLRISKVYFDFFEGFWHFPSQQNIGNVRLVAFSDSNFKNNPVDQLFLESSLNPNLAAQIYRSRQNPHVESRPLQT